MKVTKAKAAENRAAIVAAASRLFRERGFDGVGVAEIMQAAGLTHGGFYGNFASKDALAAEACACSFAQSAARATPGSGATGDDLAAYLDVYLSELHRDHPADGCPVAAYVTEVAHQDDAVQAEFTAGVARLVDCIAAAAGSGRARGRGCQGAPQPCVDGPRGDGGRDGTGPCDRPTPTASFRRRSSAPYEPRLAAWLARTRSRRQLSGLA